MPALPREILKLIVTFAMTASNNTIALPCLTGGAFVPDINTACLLLDRELYHTARRALFGPTNEFLVDKLASWTIPTLAGSYGALGSCLRDRCPASGASPLISRMTFQLGDGEDPALAKVRIDAFINVLGCMKRKLRVEELTITLANYSFRSDERLLDFCIALARGVDVGKSLVVQGLDVHLELHTRALPVFTGMVVQPLRWQVAFRTEDWRQLGRFRAEYAKKPRAAEEEEYGGLNLWQLYMELTEECRLEALGHIEDPHNEYEEWLKDAPNQSITNGLDYVSEQILEI